MAEVPITTRVYWRDDIGRFSAAVDAGAGRAMEEVSAEGARLASEFAPKKTGRLAGGIHPIGSGMHGGWATPDVPEALPQEHGAGGHVIGASGEILAGPDFGPVRGPVWHPGNPAVHYMQRSLSFMKTRITSILRRNIP